MSGHRKWSDFMARLTPEQRDRIAVRTAEMRATMPPTAYEQVRWAASEYDVGSHGYNKYYREVYQPGYPHPLTMHLCQPDDRAAGIGQLRRFLNQWKCRLPSSSDKLIADVIVEIGSYREGLFDTAIESRYVDASVFGATESVFDRLHSVPRVGPTAASKILGVLYPRFFVMWDTAIREAYFDRSDVGGREFAIFMQEMRNSAMSIVADADEHGITDPAGTISRQIGQNPPFTLAKFINDYVWLTVTKKERFPKAPAAQEHHA